ncbi:MAG: pyridoxamine 5'-phosphate oxidase family protein [Acidobacteria bacterium]|nr:MAG: pyridoxamine 5'-phosphate oxidase family protein [Acidobacteriota bacterium]
MSWNEDRIAEYLQRTVIPVRLSFLRPDGHPAVASFWYLHEGTSLWCATQDDAFVVRCLRADPRCAFEIAGDEPPYRGVRAKGLATVLPERGEEILRRLIERYLGTDSPELQRFLLGRSDDEVAIELRPERRTTWDFSDRME